jgi:hypothetical protein
MGSLYFGVNMLKAMFAHSRLYFHSRFVMNFCTSSGQKFASDLSAPSKS